VILADACVDPARAAAPRRCRSAKGRPSRSSARARDELCEPLKSQLEVQDALDRREHWRLLYVAMTRAEERLYIGGSLGPADKKGPAEASWYSAIETSFSASAATGRTILSGAAPAASATPTSPQGPQPSSRPHAQWACRPG
jgi:ATP-dependent helicase/nuclease subunit A